MNDAAVIEHFAIRWLVPKGLGTGTGDAARFGGARFDTAHFDALAAALLDGPLEDALAAAGVASDDEICIRSVVVPELVLRLAQSDAAILDVWSRAIAAAVASAAGNSGADAEGVVRYSSRSHAVVDVVVHCLAGGRAPVWAWRQLGLWPDGLGEGGAWAGGADLPSAVAAHLLRLLMARPELVVPVMVSLAGHGRLETAVAAFGAAGLRDLAEAAWRAAGGNTVPEPARPWGAQAWPAPAAPARGRAPGSLPPADPAALTAEALLRRSRLATALRPGPRYSAALTATWAVLVVLESEPAAGADPGAAALLAAVTWALATGGPVGTGSAGHGNAGGSGIGSDGGSPPLPAGITAETNTAAPESAPDSPAETEPGTEAGSRSLWAGLLYTLHVVEELEVPARLAAAGAGPAGGLRNALHALGTWMLTMAAPEEPPDDADPALLAFSGLPDAHGLSSDAAPRADAVRQEDSTLQADAAQVLRNAIHREGARVAAEVIRRVAPEDPGPAAVLARVCRHPGLIVRDPGWTDVVLDLSEVDTDVRRSGLDLDLGYLRWLGCVVRFRYV